MPFPYSFWRPNVIKNGLILWYRFNEGAGNTIHDWSNHGNAATVVNSCSWVRGNPKSPASPYGIQFNGTNQYVVSNSIIPQIGGLQKATLCGWVNGPGNCAPFGFGYDGLGESFQIDTNGTDSFYDVENAGVINLFPISNGGVYYGGWHSFVMTFDGTQNKTNIANGYNASLYFNGGSSPTSLPSASSLGAFYVGTDSDFDEYSAAIFSDIRLYNRVLSSSEIARINNCQG